MNLRHRFVTRLAFASLVIVFASTAHAQTTEVFQVDGTTCALTSVGTFDWEGWGIGAHPTAFAHSQDLFVTDLSNGLIREIRGQVTDSFPIPPGVNASDLRGAASGGRIVAENVWFTDTASGLIYELDPTTGLVVSTVALPLTLIEPGGLAVEGTSLWVVDVGTSPSRIFSFDSVTGLPLPGVPSPYLATSHPLTQGIGAALQQDAMLNDFVEFFLVDNTAPSALRSLDPASGYSLLEECDIELDGIRGVAVAPIDAGPETLISVVRFSTTPLADTDGDGVPDFSDNCSRDPNGPLLGACSAQEDADGDGFGDASDADFDNDNIVAGSDFGRLLGSFGTADPVLDFDCDGVVGGGTFGFLLINFGKAPGPGATK